MKAGGVGITGIWPKGNESFLGDSEKSYAKDTSGIWDKKERWFGWLCGKW